METIELIRWLRSVADRLEMLEEQTAGKNDAEIELEGGGASWWYVCAECHGTVDEKDHFCRHCGRKLCLPLELK